MSETESRNYRNNKDDESLYVLDSTRTNNGTSGCFFKGSRNVIIFVLIIWALYSINVLTSGLSEGDSKAQQATQEEWAIRQNVDEASPAEVQNPSITEQEAIQQGAPSDGKESKETVTTTTAEMIMNKECGQQLFLNDNIDANVTKILEEHKQKPVKCYIGRKGSGSGFGHQFTGLQSVMVLADIFKENNVFYVHFGIEGSPHTKETPDTFNKFLNIDKLFLTYNDLIKSGKSIRVEKISLDVLLKAARENNTRICNENVVYWVDNAWNLVYEPKLYLANYRFFVTHSPISHKMRKAFHSSAIQSRLDFQPGRRNIVIHVRRGDSVRDGKGLGIEYYSKGAQYYIDYFKALGDIHPPFFIVETDDKTWPELEYLKNYVGIENFAIGVDYGDGVTTAFTRMAKADGLVTSYSSFSRAAAHFRDPNVPVVACAIQDKHPWGTFVWFPEPFYVFIC